jgi:hypothetical protein
MGRIVLYLLVFCSLVWGWTSLRAEAPPDDGQAEAKLAAANKIVERVVKASGAGDVKATAVAMAEAEKLWPAHKTQYFAAMDAASRLLDGQWTRDADARAAFTLLHANVIAKPVAPIDEDHLALLEQKWTVVQRCTNLVGDGRDPKCITDLAYFVGEVRGLRIADYRNLAEKFPRAALTVLMRTGARDRTQLTDPADIAAYDQAMADNRREIFTAHVQNLLFRIDGTLSHHVVRACAGLPADHPDRAALVKKIAAIAHLTDEERRATESR